MIDFFRNEVINLHLFLNDWLTGKAAKAGGRPRRLEQALAVDFTVVHPDGRRGGKAASVNAFARAYGEKPAGYAIEIGEIDVRMIGPDTGLVTYEEWHRGEPGRARISTAVLRRDPVSDRIEWLFLQESPAPHLEAQRD